MSNSDEMASVKAEPGNRLEPQSFWGLVPKRAIETLVEVAGIIPDAPCAETLVIKEDREISPGIFIKILTKIPVVDRQILARIVERWGGLK